MTVLTNPSVSNGNRGQEHWCISEKSLCAPEIDDLNIIRNRRIDRVNYLPSDKSLTLTRIALKNEQLIRNASQWCGISHHIGDNNYIFHEAALYARAIAYKNLNDLH